MPINWVDVPDPKNPPAGAPTLSAANLAKLAVVADVGTAGTPTGDALRAAYGPLAPQFHGTRLTAYGHSFGQVQTPANCRAGSLYPARLRDLLHADPTLYGNQTISGASMDTIAAQLTSTWGSGLDGLITLMGNQNSAGTGESQTAFKAAVRSFLDLALTTSTTPPTVLVIKDTTCTSVGYARYGGGTYNDTVVATYNQWLMDVVAQYPGAPIVVADPLTDGWNPATMTAPDGQHPNDMGQAFITTSCLKVLTAASYRAGQNAGVTSAPVVIPRASGDFGPLLATLRGAPAYAAGKYGNAMSGGVLKLATDVKSPSGAGTLEAWLKTATTGTHVAVGSDGPGSNGLWIGTAGTIAGSGLYSTGGPNGTRTITDGQWHHVALTLDGTTARLWVDGVLEGSTPCVDTFDVAQGSASPVVIGGFGANAGYDWPGSVDGVRFSSAVRYTATFAPPAGPFVADGSTLALYQLDA